MHPEFVQRPDIFAACFVALCLCSIILISRQKWQKQRLPSGPQGLLIVGNLYQMRNARATGTFASWVCIH